VTGHHRILVIRLVASTCAGLEWIGAQNQLEYPFALADALACKFGYRRANPATTVGQHAASLTASASRCAGSTRLSGSAGPAQRRSACLPGRWTTGSPRSRGGGTRRGRAARPPASCREESTEAVSPAAPRADSITEIRRCRLTLPYTSLPFIPANQPGRRRAVRTATPRQGMLPSARTSDR
jgi:hypothetical protein